MSTAGTAPRVFATASAATGLALLLRAERIAAAAGRRAGRPDPRIVRVLGARQVAQAVLTLVRPTSAVLALGAAVDASHAASMVALAGASPRFRRPALASATVAGVAVGVGAALARRPSR